jgi:hypothetical protein
MKDGYQMGMTERAQPMGLSAKLVGIDGVVGRRCGEHLDGNLTLQNEIFGPIDLGHASRAHQLAQLVVAQTLPAEGSTCAG